MQRNKQSQSVRNNNAKNTGKKQYHWVAMSKYAFVSVVVNICLCVCYYEIDLLFYGQGSRLKEKKGKETYTQKLSSIVSLTSLSYF